MKWCKAAFALCAGGIFVAAMTAQASIARAGDMTDLGTLGGNYSAALAVSGDGSVIVGDSYIAGDVYDHAFSYSGGAMTDLGTLGGNYSEAQAVSGDGSVIVGDSYIAGDVYYHAFSYSGGAMTDLGTLGGTYSRAQAVSSDGSVIVGHSYIAGDVFYHAFSYSGGAMTDLGTLGGIYSAAYGVSGDGSIIVGMSFLAGASYHAFSYSGGTMTDLGTLGGGSSVARGISGDGSIIVGGSYIAGDASIHAFSYSGGAMTDLGTLGGIYSAAFGVSGDGSVIVGESDIAGDASTHAFSYSGGAMTDLGTLGGNYSRASAVSSDGSVIVGVASLAGDVEGHAFVYNNNVGGSLVDIDNTAVAISTTASNTRGYVDMRSGAMWTMADYDCADFGANDICTGVGGRYASQSGQFGEGAATLVVGIPFGDRFHAGLFLDVADNSSNPEGFKVKDPMPMVGGFVGFQDMPGAGGFGAKISGAFQRGKVQITRQVDGATEAGQGDANTRSYFVNAEVNYGLHAGPRTTVTPFASVWHSEVARDAYSETATSTVTFPVSYDKFSEKITTATAGVRVGQAITDTLYARARIGIEHDVSDRTTAFSGTSAIPGLAAFSSGGQGPEHSTRGFGSVGATFEVAPGQGISVDMAVRQQMNGGGVNGTIAASYQIAI